MRLLRAELMKLNRPLVWAVAATAVVLCSLLAVGAANGAAHDRNVVLNAPCGKDDLTGGITCAQVQAERLAKVNAVDAYTAAQLNPVAAGAEAAGLMASLPGALLVALLAGGHIGGEWSGRTLKNLLTQHGRRREVLGAKLVSLWLTAVGLLAVCWVTFAVAGPISAHAFHLSAAHISFGHAAGWAGSQVARSLLVLAVFAIIGLLAAVATRGTIGATAASCCAVLAMIIVVEFPSIGRWSPATWVQTWMGFPVDQADLTDLPDKFWSQYLGPDGLPPGHLYGFAGLALLFAVLAAAGAYLFRRTDVA